MDLRAEEDGVGLTARYISGTTACRKVKVQATFLDRARTLSVRPLPVIPAKAGIWWRPDRDFLA
jgi:hypothetical protein